MSCALLQLETQPRNLCLPQGKQEMKLLKLITFHEYKLGSRFFIFPNAKCAGIRGVSGWSPHQMGISARHSLGFTARDARLQHRNLKPRLYFKWCLSQF